MSGQPPVNQVPPTRTAVLPAGDVARSRPADSRARRARQESVAAPERLGHDSPAMALDQVVDPAQLARLLVLLGRSLPAGGTSSAAVLGPFVAPATTVVRSVDLATAALPLAFAVAVPDHPTRVVIVTPEVLPTNAVDAAEPLTAALRLALADAVGASAESLSPVVVALDAQLVAIIWTSAPGVRVAAVLDNAGFSLLARPGVHAAASAAVAALTAPSGSVAPGVGVVVAVALAVWGVVTASVPLIGAGAAALVAAFGLTPRHPASGR